FRNKPYVTYVGLCQIALRCFGGFLCQENYLSTYFRRRLATDRFNRRDIGRTGRLTCPLECCEHPKKIKKQKKGSPSGDPFSISIDSSIISFSSSFCLYLHLRSYGRFQRKQFLVSLRSYPRSF